jgi:hypothetical protein
MIVYLVYQLTSKTHILLGGFSTRDKAEDYLNKIKQDKKSEITYVSDFYGYYIDAVEIDKYLETEL